MPRKTKEQKSEEELKRKSTVRNKTKKEVKTTTKSSTAKTNSKNKSNKADLKEKANAKTTTSNKKSTTSKNRTTPKTKSSTSKTRSKKNSSAKKEIVEYYDLPYRYNQTIVKVLAQTPSNLFVYWDISDEDRENYKLQYGEDFFEKTKPVLIVHNTTLNYSFEVEINDFANSWYLHVNDSKCDYRIELGRRPITYTEKIHDDYFYISSSNDMEAPNDRVLFNPKQKMVYFRNIKTNKQTAKSVSNLSFIRNMGKIYNISDFYKIIYKEEATYKKISNPSSSYKGE